MSHKWDDAREKRLLLEVIAITNPKVEGSAWTSIAAAMGEGATAEACRQKFQGIKRNLKPGNGAAASDNKTSTPKASKTTKPKTPASTTGTKARKRKASEANANEDDEESNLFAPKSQKVKKENDANGIGAEVFKVEEEGAGVDLMRDDLYDDDAA